MVDPRQEKYSRADVIKHLENLEGTPMYKAVQSVLKETSRLKRVKAAAEVEI